MEKILTKTTPNGREIMVKFGYADNNGEYYSNFADASYQNFDRGASYAAFVALARPDIIPCWECDTIAPFMDRALTAEEKKKFESHCMEHIQRLQAGPDAVISKIAKQEKYEKKMAKYAANKARKEQKEREKVANRQKNESPTSELKEIEKVLVKKARYFYENRLNFIHFPITYKGELNLISAVCWGRNSNNYQTTSLTIGGSNERNELDELWDRVLDRELDVFCINLIRSGKDKNYKPRYIKADTPQEAFEIACKENNVKLVFNAA